MKNLNFKSIVVFLLGVLTVSGFAPFYWFPVPVLALTVLFFFWRNSLKTAHAAWLGFSYGMGLFSAGVTWLYVSLHDFGAMPPALAVFALLILCAYLSLFPAACGWLAACMRPASSYVWAGVAASGWMLMEWLRGTLFTGFPWLALGYSQAPVSPLAGFAPVVGVYGISLIMALSAALLCFWFEKGMAAWRFGALAGLIWLSGLGLQFVSWTKPTGEPVSVSLLQGNIEQDLKWREDHVEKTMRTYAELILESESRLIVTPEISIPLFNDAVPPAYLAYLADHARKNNGDVLIGLAEHATNANDAYYNSMFSFGTSPEQVYRKHHLVPFGEFIPFKPVFGWIINVLQIPLSDFSRGSTDQQPMQLAGQQVAVNICYEDVFGEEIINQLPQATLLVNVSNDAWFGRSIGPHQHLQISQMRALETGRYMLRSTNTGVTAIINERGQVLEQIEVFTTTGLHGQAQGFSGATPYVRVGNYLVLGLAGILLFIGIISSIRTVRRT
ncbi:Apolipoprotein N-acyltransferase [Nitrosomonas aestuarii]|uniref:Apolipoprotein N-acyltransferase n=1 Tax=Nitrosomonas aestuarii TaxID=52441 RepID=A0A1I3XEN7_9PROT|nr:apolipoprotein N-acyltransferase [Nitrosomonas aestuarii]SFK17993.1 Apolipoprotein N-acyltransferase [Nitrosomonas aestuarii]